MTRALRIVTALAFVAAAGPVLACGFEKAQTTTTSAPSAAAPVARSEKATSTRAQKPAKAEKAKASAEKVATRN